MSLVVAVKRNGKVYLGADTQTTSGGVRQTYLEEECRKIKRFDNGILLGAVGPKKGGKLIFSYPEIFTLPENGELDKRYVVENIAPKINELLEENDLVNIEKDNPPVWRNAFVLAYKDKLFWLYKRGSVATVDHFIAIGSGEYPAYPTLAKLDREEVCEDEKVNEALIKALQVASTRKTAVSAPFFLINTETQEFTIVK